MPTSRNNPNRVYRSGLSLLEVLLSLALLGVSLAIIHQLLNLGYRSAYEAKHRTDANILADATMAEVASGVLALESANGTIDENPDWRYSVNVQASDYLGLLNVTVTVVQVDAANPISLSIVRFMPDPNYDPTEVREQ